MRRGVKREPLSIADLKKQILAMQKVPPVFIQSERAKRARLVSELVHDAFHHWNRRFGKDQEKAVWLSAVALFHKTIEEAYPIGFWAEFEMLRTDKSCKPDLTITFLEDDPWFFRSGYVKEKLIEMIVQQQLTRGTAARLRSVVLQAILNRDRREFRRYCKLARRVSNEEFVTAVTSLSQSADEGVARRARWVLEAISN